MNPLKLDIANDPIEEIRLAELPVKILTNL
jgi:hypothetical protein